MICSRDNATETQVNIYTRAQDLPAEWGSFIPAGHYLQSAQLQVSESAQLPHLSFVYVLILSKDQPVAAASFQVLDLKKQHINARQVSAVQALAWNLFTTTLHPKLLVAGHLFRHDIFSFYYDPALKPFDAFQYYKQAIDKALKFSCAQAVLVKDMPEELVTYFQHYEPQYILLRNDISMEMDIAPEWQTLHDYEKSLKHKYAQKLRKVRQPWNALEIKELSTAQVEEHKNELFTLYKQVTDNQQVRMGFLSLEFIVQLKKFYGDELRVWAAYEGEKMIAFFSAWVREDAFDMFYIGFDYRRNSDLQLYFNILFFSIEQAILFKRPKLILGRTALDAKARLGCKPHYLYTFLYIKNSFIRNRVLAAQQRTSAKEGAWEERHPFKGG